MPHTLRYLPLVVLLPLAACTTSGHTAPDRPVEISPTTTTAPPVREAGVLCHDSTGYPYRTDRCPT